MPEPRPLPGWLGFAHAVPVAEVEMPELDLDPVTWEEQRQLALDLLENDDWIARTPLGYVITRYDDATAMLRDDRWYSAIGLIADMQGYDDPDFRQALKPQHPGHGRR